MSNPFNNVKPINNYNMNNLQSMYSMLMNSRNPMAILENLSQNNPQLKPIINALKNGSNPKALFERLCRERGIDPNEFLKGIQGK